MALPTLALMLQLASTGPDLSMPPPPPGMQLMTPKQAARLAAAESSAEEPERSPKVEEESAELEELRAVEEVALQPQTRPSAAVLQSVRRLGFGNPLRQRMQEAMDETVLRDEEARFELSPVTNVAAIDIAQLQKEYDIPVEMQPLVATYIQFFQGSGRRWFRKWMGRSTRYIPMMQPLLEKEGLPKDMVYLAMIESGFSTSAISWAQAAGPWQFIASTGKMYGLKQDFWVDERRDPLKATTAAARYLKLLNHDLGHWYLAWAGYNAGAGRVRHMMKYKNTADFWQLSSGRGLAKETKHYVPKLIACAIVAKHPKAFGFAEDEFQFEQPYEFDEVTVPDATDLEVVARSAQVTVEEIREMNPELKRWCTPPAVGKTGYTLRVPKGAGVRFTENFAKIAPQDRMTFRAHQVRRGDTLSRIASTYGSAAEAIMRLNGLKNYRSLRLNTWLMVPVPSAHATQGRRDPALERQVIRAKHSGVVATRPEDEVPAGTSTKPVATGPIKTESLNGKTRITYGVQSGDNLWSISQRFNCTVEELRTWNQLPHSNRGLKVGTVLAIWPGDKRLSLATP